MVTVRPERKSDYETVRGVLVLAFGQENEAKLVEALRNLAIVQGCISYAVILLSPKILEWLGVSFLQLAMFRFAGLGRWSVWIDEAYTLADARHSPGALNPIGYWLFDAFYSLDPENDPLIYALADDPEPLAR